MNELIKLSLERSRELFPDIKIKPLIAFWSGGIYRCTMAVGENNEVVAGTGHNMNECCNNLNENITSILERKGNPDISEKKGGLL
jgi:hypothetical protein